MATGQTILDTMEVIFPELQLQSGESNVTRALIAVNRSQDTLEMIVAQYPDLLGTDVGSVTTTASTEYTTFPSGVLRIDSLDYIDSVTSLPSYGLHNIKSAGGHRYYDSWPYNIVSSSASGGRPVGYWTNGTRIYWSPLPDATYTVRWYGFEAASDITAGGTFAYPDGLILPVAVFAGKLLRLGLDDPTADYSKLMEECFQPAVDALSNFNRTGAKGYRYTRTHDT